MEENGMPIGTAGSQRLESARLSIIFQRLSAALESRCRVFLFDGDRRHSSGDKSALGSKKSDWGEESRPAEGSESVTVFGVVVHDKHLSIRVNAIFGVNDHSS